MAIDSEKLKQIATQAAGSLGAGGALVVTLSGGVEWLQKQLQAISMPPSVALAIAWSLVGAAGVFSIVLAWRASIRRSALRRPDAFDLKVARRQQLKGRDQDVGDLKALLTDHELIFLIGQSGCGKSALVSAAIVPEVAAEGRFLPVLIARYGSDWYSGPLKEVSLALWEALSDSDRATLQLTGRPDPTASTISDLEVQLAAIPKKLGRTPLLIFDQFDDYQLRHREKFISTGGAWISARNLRGRNPFWRVIAASLSAHAASCMFVTRNDSADGLFSVAFVGKPAARPLAPVQGEFVRSMLDDLAPPDASPLIVDFPEAGWTTLKEVLSTELQHDGMALPQQIRTAVLGLRHLPALTVREFRRAGGVRGIEARFIARAIASAAQQVAVSPIVVRTLLSVLVERNLREGEPKTRRCSENELRQLSSNAASVTPTLHYLAQLEIARAIPNAETGEVDWQLDHDYLARAVIEEERIQNRESILLREAATIWRAAAGEWRRRWWTALLPLSTQARLLCGRIRRGSTFRYGLDSDYARRSTLRLAPLALAAIGIVTLSLWSLVESQARDILDKLSGVDGIVSLWSANDAVRYRVSTRLLQNPRLMSGISPNWALAVVGFEPITSARLVDRLVEHALRAADDDLTARGSLAGVLSLVATRVELADAAATADKLKKALANTTDPARKVQLYRLLSSLGFALAPGDLTQLSLELTNQLKELTKRGDDADAYYVLEAITQFAPSTSRVMAAELADDILVELKTTKSGFKRMMYLRILAALGPNLPEAIAGRVAQEIVARMPAFSTVERQAAYSALASIAPKLSSSASAIILTAARAAWRNDDTSDGGALQLFSAMTARLGATDLALLINEINTQPTKIFDPSRRDPLLQLIALTSPNASKESAARTTRTLLARLTTDVDSDEWFLVAQALAVFARQLAPEAAAEFAEQALQRCVRAKSVARPITRTACGEMMAGAAQNMQQNDAERVAADIRAELEKSRDPSLDAMLDAMLGSIAPSLNPASSAAVRKELRARLRKTSDPLRQADLVFSLTHAADKLQDDREAGDIVDDLLSVLDTSRTYALQAQTIQALGELAPHSTGVTLPRLVSTLLRWVERSGSEGTFDQIFPALTFSCQELARTTRSQRSRKVGVECLLLLVSAPFTSMEPAMPDSARPTAWESLEALSGQPLERDVRKARAWAREQFQIDPYDVRVRIVRDHIEALR